MSKTAASRAERAIRRGVIEGRKNLFAELAKYDRGLAARLERQAARVRREVGAMTRLSRAARNRRVASLIRQRMTRLLREERRRIAEATITAAQQGVRAGNVTAQQAQTLAEFVAGESAPALVVETAEAANAASFSRSLVNPRLSSLLRSNASETAEQFALQIQGSLHQGESVITAANRLLAAEDPIVHLPRYVEDLRAAVRIGHPGEIRTAARRAIREARQLGLRAPRAATTLRNSATQLAKAARSGRTADVERQVRYFVQEKARYQARRVARTEMSRAFNEAYIASSSASPSVKGMKWNLSSSHPMPDVCDMYASVDVAGLGAGVYPENDLQQLPAHPHCLCFYTAVLRTPEEIASGRDAPRGRPQTYRQWMRRQSRTTQESILGPGRARAFRRGGARARRVVTDDGRLNPLWRVQRRRRPTRNLGRAVDVRREAGDLLPPKTKRET